MSETASEALILQSLSNIQEDIGRLRTEQSDERASASESRRRMFREISVNKDLLTEQSHSILEVKHDVENVSSRVADLENEMGEVRPTLKEVAEYKLKAQGAGLLGQLLFRFGYWILAAAAAIYAAWDSIVAAIRGFLR